ncbi:MaoC family dehydratase [Subtercola frigoramans]|uniref:Acyl dehydratase n=1 Tax=Subtercola frigoramans TaxID=120298 RepID=A0ABS2L7M1_9MICO|nr:MaoC family dehydratase [Subtercola frigoramans]MBM7473097.1 acyl dehydratase [Subtercola frigoramans]
MMTITPATQFDELIGAPPHRGSWWAIDQERIDAFAAATGDHQWLHVDPKRAADGPYGRTIAHGFLVLSLLPAMTAEVLATEGFSAIINYGLEKVRFPAPVLVSARIRNSLALDGARDTDKGILLTVTHTVEIEGQDRPACVAQQLRLLAQ